jgi:predicted enzyme related to lactoylglutathione lyase
MLKSIESVVLFVQDIDAAAAWYAAIFGTEVLHENDQYAYIHAPGVLYGFHPADDKCPGGIGGTTVYWQVEDLDVAVEDLVARGARVHRGPGKTSFGAGVAMLVCPFGCTIGLNQSTPQSQTLIASQAKDPGTATSAA